MAVDLAILKLLKYRKDFRRVHGRIPASSMNKETVAILDDFGKYFERFPEAEHVDMETFTPLFRAWHSTLTDEQRKMFETVLNNAEEDVPEKAREEIMRAVLELRLATDTANALARFDEGELPNLGAYIAALHTEFKADSDTAKEDFIQDDIHDLLEEDEIDFGLTSRLDCVNKSMRPLRPGDFMIIAARPDRGKTTLVASEATHWATQIPPDRNILWLNNEGPGRRIIPRLYQAALGATRTQLLTLRQANALKPAYIKLMGRIDKIRVKDIHGLDTYAVERIIEANNAEVVIYDMLDHVRGYENQARTDQRLEELYKWARSLAVEHEHIGIATSQVSVEGDNMQFPAQSMLKDSKTGKQGACDAIMIMGALNDPQYDKMRWIGLPKNKMRRDGAAGDPRECVQFDANRARVEDIPIQEI